MPSSSQSRASRMVSWMIWWSRSGSMDAGKRKSLNFTRGLPLSASQGEQERSPHLGHFGEAHRGDQGADLCAVHRLHVVEIDGAFSRHPVGRRQPHFRRNVSDRRRDGRHGDLPEKLERGVPREDENGAPLVGGAEPIPSDLSSPHRSPHDCSASHTSNSPFLTGARAYPSRCFFSRSRARTSRSATRRASRVKADRVVPSRLAARSTAVTNSSSSVI